MWFLFIMAIPFSEVILQSFSDHLRFKMKHVDRINPEQVKIHINDQNRMVPLVDNFVTKKKDNILGKLEFVKNIGKYYLPSVFVIFSISYISIGLCLKYSFI